MIIVRRAVILLLALVILLPCSVASANGEGSGLLASLTVSPSPDWHIPFDPQNRNPGGGFADDINPEEITVIAVTENPDATFTINGQPGVNGEPMTFQWDKWTPRLELNMVITDPDGSSGQYVIRLGKMVHLPFVTVDPIANAVGGVRFEADATLTMTVYSEPGGVLLAESTTPSNNRGGIFVWEFRELGIPVLLQAGMEVRITDGVNTATHVVLPMTFGFAEFFDDTIWGTGAPGARLNLLVFPDGDKVENAEVVRLSGGSIESFDPAFIVDASGHWEFDLGAEGIDINRYTVIDVQSFLNPSLSASYDPGINKEGHTHVMWPIYDGIDISAFLDFNAVGIDELPSADINVNLTIRSSPGGPVLFTDSQLSDASGSAVWGVPLSPDLTVVLEPGMEVTLTWGEAFRSAVLDNTRVDVVDPELDQVSGVGPANEGIILIIADVTDDKFTPLAVSDVPIEPDGSWQADFTEDITVGMMALAFRTYNGFNFGAAGIAVVEPKVIEENPSIGETSDVTEVVVGTVAQDGSLVQVAVPASALPSGSLVRVAAIANTNNLIEQVAVPEGTDVALGFSIGATAPDGSDMRVDFAAPVSIEFTVESDTLPAGFDTDSLSIAFWNGARWAALENVQAVTNTDGTVTLSALTNHFTLFTVVTDPTGAIRPGPADPLDEASLPVLGQSEWNQYLGGNDQDHLPALIIWAAVIVSLIAIVWVIVRRKRKTARS
ncbi:hypothetical protein ACFLUL_00765 [Chloroflexota bacterium]